ncbi:hypothetical protein MW887_010033 [Aspergillus wentii]|nr:hypothetical protein MW887_010033 [Aspergillus wentii]
MPSLWTSAEAGFGCTFEKDFNWESAAISDSESEASEGSSTAGFPSDALWSQFKAQLDSEHEASDSEMSKSKFEMVPAISRSVTERLCGRESRPRAVKTAPLGPSAANTAPSEILFQIFCMLSPRDFDNARRTCSQWMRVSLNQDLLESMLKRAGWWDVWQRDCQMQRPPVSDYEDHSVVWRMSRRFATECILSGRKINVERRGFLTTSVIDFSKLSQGKLTPRHRGPLFHPAPTAMTKFSVSNCGNYLLVTSGRVVYVYHLRTRKSGNSIPVSLNDMADTDITLLASIPCPIEVLSATIDTSTPKLVVAVLLRNRVGMVCDLVSTNDNTPGCDTTKNGYNSMQNQMHLLNPASRHYFINLCSPDDPPRSVSICPGRRCVAFGCGTGIELHWVDESTKQDCRKHFPMSQPSEVLHFLPNRTETPMELRLVSSLAGPGMPGWENGNVSLVKATHCHHYRAIPINDGLHLLFIEPRTGLLCIGSDSPIGGPTSLTRALICVPPYGKYTSDGIKEALVPTVFAVGSDLSWGLRIVAAYQDRLILYSVPLDVFNVIRKERERQGDGVMGDSDIARDWFLDGDRSRTRRESLVQNQNGDWEFLLSVSYRPTAMMWPFKIYGKEIGRMENVVELSLQSSYGGARVWAFGASGKTNIIDIDTFTTTTQRASDIPCKSLVIDTDGSVASAQLVDRTEPGLLTPQSSRKRKQFEERETFVGKHSAAYPFHNTLLNRFDPSVFSRGDIQLANASAKRRPSLTACIVDFKVPELGCREGRWVENSCA